jgi:hypothetical protein
MHVGSWKKRLRCDILARTQQACGSDDAGEGAEDWFKRH